MSFIINESGKTYAPGYFLAHEECRRETREFTQAMGTTAANGGKYVKAGTFYPENSSSTVKGIVYEDVDVTSGSMPGSVVTAGVVYTGRLAEAAESGVQSALEALGFTFLTEPTVTRATDIGLDGTLDSITVNSAAGTATGDTKLTVTYTGKPGDASYFYKVTDTTAETVAYGEVLDSTWTSWNGTADITAATSKKLALVAAVGGCAVGYGSCTVTAKT